MDDQERFMIQEQLVIRDLELAELRSQNLNLGARIVDLESETISQRRRIVELEAELALAQRVKMREQIEKAREQAERSLADSKAAAAAIFGIENTDDLTAAKLKEH